MISAPVARNVITVMVLKRRVLQSLFDFDLATEIRQDPAVCVSLPSNSIVKEQKFEFREHKPARRRTAGFFRDNEAPTGMSRLGTTEFREFDALRGRRSSDARQRGSFKQQPGLGVNTPFKNSLLFAGRDQ